MDAFAAKNDRGQVQAFQAFGRFIGTEILFVSVYWQPEPPSFYGVGKRPLGVEFGIPLLSTSDLMHYDENKPELRTSSSCPRSSTAIVRRQRWCCTKSTWLLLGAAKAESWACLPCEFSTREGGDWKLNSFRAA